MSDYLVVTEAKQDQLSGALEFQGRFYVPCENHTRSNVDVAKEVAHDLSVRGIQRALVAEVEFEQLRIIALVASTTSSVCWNI